MRPAPTPSKPRASLAFGTADPGGAGTALRGRLASGYCGSTARPIQPWTDFGPRDWVDPPPWPQAPLIQPHPTQERPNGSNLVLLCRFHHRAVHEEGFSVKLLRGRFGLPGGAESRPREIIRFFARTGWPLPDLAPPPVLKGPLSGLVQTQHEKGVRPDGHTASARWRRSGDIPWELEAQARKALDS